MLYKCTFKNRMFYLIYLCLNRLNWIAIIIGFKSKTNFMTLG